MAYPVEAFFSDPVRAGASISPDGTTIAYLAPENGRLNVWLEPVAACLDPERTCLDPERNGEAICVTHDHNRAITKYRWTADPRWMLYLQDGDGDENWHVFRVDVENPDQPAVELTPGPEVRVAELELLAEFPFAHVATNERRPDETDVWRLDILTGEKTIVAQNDGTISNWALGPSGAIFAETMDDEGNQTIHRWNDDGSKTALVSFVGADNPLGFTPCDVTPSGDGLWVGSNTNTEHTRLVHISAVDGSETVLAARDDLSIDETSGVMPALPPALIKSRATGELLAVRFYGQRQELEILDPGFKDVYAELAKLSTGDLGAVSHDKSGRRWLATFTHDTEPDYTYFYDHETGESRLLYKPFPHLDADVLSPMKPVVITSRDGLPLYSYLTLPRGVEPTNLPMVLLVHGGPWFRDKWGYNPRAALLANLGYAVLQVNMRGSTGFGKSFVRASYREFAGKMHDDLIDAVHWAVAEGIADKDRVAIFGGSYGGYSALVGATFTPEVFASCIDFCGISNWVNFMRTLPIMVRKFLASNWLLYLGDPDDPDEHDYMMSVSPITKIDNVCRPLMVIQGAKDVRVIQEESDNVVEYLRNKGLDVEYVLKENEGHGFVNPENNIDMFKQIEKFLARTIGDERPA